PAKQSRGGRVTLEAAADTTWRDFSLAERDRRWNAVRQNAAAAGLDCVWVPLCLDPRNFALSLEQARGVRSDGRYLTLLENATFVDATDVVGFARYVKSDEEVDALRRGAAIAAAGIDEMARVARPGVAEATLYASVMRRILELGSEYYPLALYASEIDTPAYR